MLGSRRGFTVIQFITGMTVVGLLLMGVFVAVAKQVGRDNQRRSDLVTIDAMVKRVAEQHHGQFPGAKDGDNPGSDLRVEFEKLRLTDPKAGSTYVMGSDFGSCDSRADIDKLGPGFVSYGRPGVNGSPYKLRICLERGEYYVGD
jgi:hypothetical protein